MTIVEKKIGYKCVVKPLNGGQGRGITSNISNCLELKHAVHKAFEESKVDEPIIVEKHVDGYDYRLLFINGIHVGCVERGYPFVVGNGRSTVRELIEDHNKNRTISVYKSIFRRPVKIDSEVSRCLEANNLDFGSIPDDGVKVYLRSTQNASSGGTVRRVDNVHPKVLAKATEVASASGAYSIGVDYISHDISANPRITSGVFTEINKTPGVPAFIASGSDPAEIGKLFLESGCYNVPVNIFISDSKNLKETLKAMGLKEVFISPNYIFKNGKIYKLPSRYYLENLAIYSKNRKLNELSIIIFSEYITQIGIPEHTSSIFINSCVDVSVRSFVEESGFSFS